MPRLGSSVRIASPAPNFLREFKYLKRLPSGGRFAIAATSPPCRHRPSFRALMRPRAGNRSAAFAFGGSSMRTIVYIDGFNLYYRMLKNRPASKWMNPLALAQQFIKPGDVITRLNYYIARVSARAHDPHAPARQATYLSALANVSEISVHEGTFMTSEPWMQLAAPPQARPDGYAWNVPPPSVVKVI